MLSLKPKEMKTERPNKKMPNHRMKKTRMQLGFITRLQRDMNFFIFVKESSKKTREKQICFSFANNEGVYNEENI